jgi:hypothetical protein
MLGRVVESAATQNRGKRREVSRIMNGKRNPFFEENNFVRRIGDKILPAN